MYPIVLPDSRTRELPTRWGEVTLGQAARLAELPEGADVYSFLAALLSLSPLEVMNLPHALVVEQLLPVLSFASDTEPDFAAFTMPNSVTLPRNEDPGSTVAVPAITDLTAATFGQATDLGAVLQDAALPVAEKRIQVLAILLYPGYSFGAYDSDHIAAFAEHVCAFARLEEALPLTDFFLSSTTAFAAATSPSSSASPSAPTSAPPASKPSWQNGMRWLWSTRWPVATKPSGPTSGASSGAR